MKPNLIIRPAASSDVPMIYDNIAYWAERGRMLVRSHQNLFENLRDFFVAELETVNGPVFAGSSALHVLWGDIAEVRSLAVAPTAQARGVGTALVQACEHEGQRLGIPQTFAWTYEVEFFEKCGYHLVRNQEDFHPRVWSESRRRPFVTCCNKDGVLKRLDQVPWPSNVPKPPAPTQVPPGIQ